MFRHKAEGLNPIQHLATESERTTGRVNRNVKALTVAEICLVLLLTVLALFAVVTVVRDIIVAGCHQLAESLGFVNVHSFPALPYWPFIALLVLLLLYLFRPWRIFRKREYAGASFAALDFANELKARHELAAAQRQKILTYILFGLTLLLAVSLLFAVVTRHLPGSSKTSASCLFVGGGGSVSNTKHPTPPVAVVTPTPTPTPASTATPIPTPTPTATPVPTPRPTATPTPTGSTTGGCTVTATGWSCGGTTTGTAPTALHKPSPKPRATPKPTPTPTPRATPKPPPVPASSPPTLAAAMLTPTVGEVDMLTVGNLGPGDPGVWSLAGDEVGHCQAVTTHCVVPATSAVAGNVTYQAVTAKGLKSNVVTVDWVAPVPAPPTPPPTPTPKPAPAPPTLAAGPVSVGSGGSESAVLTAASMTTGVTYTLYSSLAAGGKFTALVPVNTSCASPTTSATCTYTVTGTTGTVYYELQGSDGSVSNVVSEDWTYVMSLKITHGSATTPVTDPPTLTLSNAKPTATYYFGSSPMTDQNTYLGECITDSSGSCSISPLGWGNEYAATAGSVTYQAILNSLEYGLGSTPPPSVELSNPVTIDWTAAVVPTLAASTLTPTGNVPPVFSVTGAGPDQILYLPNPGFNNENVLASCTTNSAGSCTFAVQPYLSYPQGSLAPGQGGDPNAPLVAEYAFCPQPLSATGGQVTFSRTPPGCVAPIDGGNLSPPPGQSNPVTITWPPSIDVAAYQVGTTRQVSQADPGEAVTLALSGASPDTSYTVSQSTSSSMSDPTVAFTCTTDGSGDCTYTYPAPASAGTLYFQIIAPTVAALPTPVTWLAAVPPVLASNGFNSVSNPTSESFVVSSTTAGVTYTLYSASASAPKSYSSLDLSCTAVSADNCSWTAPAPTGGGMWLYQLRGSDGSVSNTVVVTW